MGYFKVLSILSPGSCKINKPHLKIPFSGTCQLYAIAGLNVIFLAEGKQGSFGTEDTNLSVFQIFCA